MAATHDDYIVKSFDGLELVTRTWNIPKDTPAKGRVVFVHGYCEHIAAYDDWFPPIAEAGYEVTLYDARGHGHTAKTPNDFGRADEEKVMGDLEAIIDEAFARAAKSSDPELPKILWGFSMGGSIVLNYMVIGKHKNDFDAYISTGPMILRAPELRRGFLGFKSSLLPRLRNIVPNHTEKIPLNVEDLNNNQAKKDSYQKDDLRHRVTSVAFMHDAIKRGERLLDPDFIKDIADRPLLLSHGTVDRLCDFKASEEFIAKAPLKNKTLEPYPDKLHELMQNVDEDTAIHRKNILEWLSKNLTSTP